MPKKRLCSAARREQIIQVSMDLFASLGFKGATTRAIAEAAGVSEAIIFRHFATKEDLYDAIITTTIEKRRAVWKLESPSRDKNEDLSGLLREYATGFINRNRTDQTFIRLMLYSALEDHKFRQRFFESHSSPYMQAIRNRISHGIVIGEYVETDPHFTMFSFFCSLYQYSVSRFVASSQQPPEDEDTLFIENLIKIYVTSLKSTALKPSPISSCPISSPYEKKRDDKTIHRNPGKDPNVAAPSARLGARNPEDLQDQT
jgi:AcrR family transcriptional regulator